MILWPDRSPIGNSFIKKSKHHIRWAFASEVQGRARGGHSIVEIRIIFSGQVSSNSGNGHLVVTNHGPSDSQMLFIGIPFPPEPNNEDEDDEATNQFRKFIKPIAITRRAFIVSVVLCFYIEESIVGSSLPRSDHVLLYLLALPLLPFEELLLI